VKLRDPNEVKNPHWNLGQRFLKLPNGEYISLREAVAGGFFINGQPGSGKSSSSYRLIIKSLMRLGGGGVLFAAKPQDALRFIDWSKLENREKDVLVVSADSGHCCDAFAYEQAMGGGNVEGLVQLPTRILELLERGESSKTEAYWVQNQQKALRNAATVMKCSGRPSSLRLMEEILQTAPECPEEVHDPDFQTKSTCIRLLDEAMERRDQMTPSERRDFDRAANYLLQELPSMGKESKLRTSIMVGLTATFDVFLNGTVGDLWANGLSTFVPELCAHGAIIIHALDPKTSGENVGLVSATTLKTTVTRAFERRGEGDGKTNRRPLFVGIDECQQLLTESEPRFLATARSAGVVVVLATQNIPGLELALGGHESAKVAVRNLLGLVGTHIIHSQTCAQTAEYYADLIGRESQYRGNFGGAMMNGVERNSAGGSETIDYVLQPHQFAGGRCGGPENNFLCDAILYSSGRTFKATGKRYVPVAISQKD